MTKRVERPLDLHAADDEAPVRVAVARPPPAAGEGSGPEEMTLRDMLALLADGRWYVVTAAAIALLGGILYALLATPIYRTDALVQVEEQSKNGALDELSTLFSGSSPTEAEVEIIRSRSLVGGVVEELRLDLSAGPHYFPVIGRALARWRDGPAPASPFLGLSRYAWGGEKLSVQRLDVPPELEGGELTLVAGDGGRFTLLGPEGERLVEGQVGRAADGQGVSLFVEQLQARPETQFRIAKSSRNAATDRLRRDLAVAEIGKKTGIIRLELEGRSPSQIAATLNAVTRAYLRQNVERKSAEAEKTLAFLETQLPIVKANLDSAESALNAYRSRNGSVDVTLETQGRLDQAVQVERALSELDVQRAELKQRFTESHPVLMAIRHKQAQLQSERASIEAKIKLLPNAELESARLMRDVKVSNELYVLLLNKAQELRVMKSGTIGSVRIVDSAVVPGEPVSPRKGASAVLGLLLGLGVGVGLAFARKALDRGVEDPEVIEQRFGVSVYAAVPHSAKVNELDRDARRRKVAGVPLLATADPSDVAIESLRSLRTSLEFALVEATGNVVMIGGPSPGVGKSFVSVNLAAVLADTGKRVLLVDADMRKGRLHRQFGAERGPGLSELISGSVGVDDAVRTTTARDVWLLPTGRLPPNPSELLASERFRRVLAELSRRWDIVLVDTAPILAVTDAALIGRFASLTLVVLRAGQHPLREIALAAKQLSQNGVRPHGFVLNDVMPRSTVLGSKYSYHYHYDYR
jgi:tyrosine-protein kinase Etk/Wzc